MLRLERSQPSLLDPERSVVIRQVTHVAPCQDQKRHAFAIRGAGRAVEHLVVGLDFGRQAEGWGNGFLAIEALIVEQIVIGVEQRMTDGAVQQLAFAIQRLIFQPRQRAGLGDDAHMQATI